MLSSLIRRAAIVKRFSTEYVLAHRVNGKLIEAEFDRDDKDFCYNPRLTASVKLDGKDGLCTIGGVYKIVSENQIGTVKNIQSPKDRKWYGFIGPKKEEDVKQENLIFGLNENPSLNEVNWKDPEQMFSYDAVCYLHDDNKLTALNITPIEPKKE